MDKGVHQEQGSPLKNINIAWFLDHIRRNKFKSYSKGRTDEKGRDANPREGD